MKRIGLISIALCCSASAYADVDLFPKKALQSATVPNDAPRDRPIEPAWRAVEHGAFERFQPRASQVSDETPQALLAKQLARRREAPATPPDRSSDDSRATPNEPRLLYAQRESQVDLAQAAYEEPATWERIEVEVSVDATGHVEKARVVSGSPRSNLNEQALDAVRRAASAAAGLGAHGAVVARLEVEAGVSVAMPARAVSYEVKPRPKGVMVPIVRGRFGSGTKTEVSAPLQPRVRTRVTLIELSPGR
jgi:TonB family protein